MNDYDRLQEAADREINRLEQALEDCQAASGNMDSAMRADVLELRVREQAAEIEQQKEMRRGAISAALAWRNENTRLQAALQEFHAMTPAKFDSELPDWSSGYNCAIGEIVEILKRTDTIHRALDESEGGE